MGQWLVRPRCVPCHNCLDCILPICRPVSADSTKLEHCAFDGLIGPYEPRIPEMRAHVQRLGCTQHRLDVQLAKVPALPMHATTADQVDVTSIRVFVNRRCAAFAPEFVLQHHGVRANCSGMGGLNMWRDLPHRWICDRVGSIATQHEPGDLMWTNRLVQVMLLLEETDATDAGRRWGCRSSAPTKRFSE